ncbi:MAG: SGNH/GDSL hydrolase family protein [Clostridia bacterium]|nr:SGNH/GDSL hydrolase family protein [Clostridia bacterium]
MKETNPLNKKSVLFVGDSIGEAACEWNSADYGNTVGWPGRIMAWNEMSGFNACKGGASVGDCRGENLVINQLIANKDNEYDYVIIEGGGNDAWDSAPVGVMTEGFDGPFDTAAFGGGLENTFKYAKENYKNAIFGFIIVYQMPSSQFGRMSDMSEYFSLAKKICDKWEIPYIDLYFDEDFNKNVMKSETPENIPDTVHANSSGYNIISPMINDWMKTL